jgi:hypothetical protein
VWHTPFQRECLLSVSARRPHPWVVLVVACWLLYEGAACVQGEEICRALHARLSLVISGAGSRSGLLLCRRHQVVSRRCVAGAASVAATAAVSARNAATGRQY